LTSFNDLKKKVKQFDGGNGGDGLPALRVALLGDSATQFLGVGLRGIGLERGERFDLFEAEYGQVERQVLSGDSELYLFDADYVVVFQCTKKLLVHYEELPPAQKPLLADERLDFVRVLAAAFVGKRARVIYCNYPEIDDGVFGGFANKTDASFLYQTRKLNYGLAELAAGTPGLFIADVASLQNKYGRDWLFDATVYTSTEMTLSIDSVPFVASRIADIIGACQGQIKKAVILDLDNTLWGGVIGDDGIENIQLGHGLGIGKAFTEFQLWLKSLKERGVILAICSKNDEAVAKEPFLRHPDMALRLEDIAVFVANWENKADNIRRIQNILNIGFDSIIFLDDNPAERAIVRENIPGITVPELPADSADYVEYLANLNLFETASRSGEDSKRTKQYQAEAERAGARVSFTNEADFLKSLAMAAVVESFTPFNTPRVAQLTQRSNQFNLRTVRYTEADIASLSADPRYAPFAFSLKDKFGDNGLIAVVVLEKQDAQTLFINEWLMSCRVLKRGMENFTLNTVAAYARANNFKRVIGEYIPTAKNKMVENHYAGLGFEPLADPSRKLWTLDVQTFTPRECYITATA
jgi:FkbH-like protein